MGIWWDVSVVIASQVFFSSRHSTGVGTDTATVGHLAGAHFGPLSFFFILWLCNGLYSMKGSYPSQPIPQKKKITDVVKSEM